MVNFPWSNDESGDTDDALDDGAGEPSGVDTGGGGARGSDGDRTAPADSDDPISKDEAILTCKFQDGTLYVFEDILCIERPGRSKFSEKWIALNQVRGVNYERRLVISYLQIDQVDFQPSEEGLISTPVDENTLHFGRGKRECAQRATDQILEGMDAE